MKKAGNRIQHLTLEVRRNKRYFFSKYFALTSSNEGKSL